MRIYDYADLNVPMLARMFDRRCRGYEAVGYTVLLPASAIPGWPADVILPSDPAWKRDYSGSVRRLVRDDVDTPLASLFVHVARTVAPDADGAQRARSSTEAFLFRRLETLAETKGRFGVNVTLPRFETRLARTLSHPERHERSHREAKCSDCYHLAMTMPKRPMNPAKPARRPRSSASGAATTIDEYLARVEPEQRDALEALRQLIRKAAPNAEEVITYGIPAFRENGFVIGFAASARHCSLHPMNSHTVADFAAELSGYSTSTGTIRFTPDRPLPAALVRKIVKARVTENNADAKAKVAMKGRRTG